MRIQSHALAHSTVIWHFATSNFSYNTIYYIFNWYGRTSSGLTLYQWWGNLKNSDVESYFYAHPDFRTEVLFRQNLNDTKCRAQAPLRSGCSSDQFASWHRIRLHQTDAIVHILCSFLRWANTPFHGSDAFSWKNRSDLRSSYDFVRKQTRKTLKTIKTYCDSYQLVDKASFARVSVRVILIVVSFCVSQSTFSAFQSTQRTLYTAAFEIIQNYDCFCLNSP